MFDIFEHNWLHVNYNSNKAILIPKIPDAYTMEQYRPILLNFLKIKIITKVIADRLVIIMTNIISPHHRGLIKERYINDCIYISYE